MKVIAGEPVDLAGVDLRWMLGRSVVAYSHHEPDLWVISFSGGGSLSTQDTWRILRADCMVVSSADHGHEFGLPEPVNVEVLANSETVGSLIVDVRIDVAAPDLLVRFENDSLLQVLATSAGFECWQTCDPSGRCFVIRGDRSAATWVEEP